MNDECLICQVKALEKRVEKYAIPAENRSRIVSNLLKQIVAIDLENSYSPEITRNILHALSQSSEVADPYLPEK